MSNKAAGWPTIHGGFLRIHLKLWLKNSSVELQLGETYLKRWATRSKNLRYKSKAALT